MFAGCCVSVCRQVLWSVLRNWDELEVAGVAAVCGDV